MSTEELSIIEEVSFVEESPSTKKSRAAESLVPNVDPSHLLKGKLDACASTLSPLLLALTLVAGLGFLCVENLTGAGVPHWKDDHSEAVLKLLFRN